MKNKFHLSIIVGIVIILIFLAVVFYSIDYSEKEEEVFEDTTQVFCTQDDRNAEACAAIYSPVCGRYYENISAKTYSNGCFACADEKVNFWMQGECPE